VTFGRRRSAALAALVGVAALLVACSSATPAHAGRSSTNSHIRPSRIYPGPAGLLSVGPPQSNGVMWLLSGSATVKALNELDLSSGQVLSAVPESSAAVSVSQSVSGVLAVGLATATSGAVEIRNGSTGALLSTIPVGSPVRQLAFGSDGTTLYVLNGTASSSSVTVVDTQTGKVEGSVGVSLSTVGIAPTSDQTGIWTVQNTGTVTEVATAGTHVITQFTVGHSGTSLVLSPGGNTLYVLKGRSYAPNVAVVDLATEQVRRVLPAPADCLAITIAPSGTTLYDAVGTPSVGNIQAFPLEG